MLCSQFSETAYLAAFISIPLNHWAEYIASYISTEYTITTLSSSRFNALQNPEKKKWKIYVQCYFKKSCQYTYACSRFYMIIQLTQHFVTVTILNVDTNGNYILQYNNLSEFIREHCYMFFNKSQNILLKATISSYMFTYVKGMQK